MQKLPRTFYLFIIIFLNILLSACVNQKNNVDFDLQNAAKARIELGLGYLAQQNFEQAKLNFDKAMNYAPNYYLLYSAYAYYYQQRGDIEKAEQFYQKSLKLDNSQGDSHNNYGTFLCSQAKFDLAYQQFEQALNSPNYYRQADSLENIALCAKSENNLQRYQQSLSQLEKLDPERARKLALLK